MIYLEKEQHNQRLWINIKHLVMRPNQEAIPDSEIKRLVLKTQYLRLFHLLDWMVTVLL